MATGLLEILALIAAVVQAAPELKDLFQSAVNGETPSPEQIAAKEARYQELKSERDGLIAKAEQRLADKQMAPPPGESA